MTLYVFVYASFAQRFRVLNYNNAHKYSFDTPLKIMEVTSGQAKVHTFKEISDVTLAQYKQECFPVGWVPTAAVAVPRCQ